MSFNFNDIKINTKNRVLVVDALNLGFRWKHQGKLEFAEEYQRTIESLASSYKCGRIIVAADQGSSQYRKTILPTYKQNRKDKYSMQTEEEKYAFKMFFDEYENTLEILSHRHTVLRYAATEADDIAAYLVKKKEHFGFEQMWLISSDRDWDLLIQEEVSRFSYVNRKEVTFDNWHDHYDVPISSYACYKALTGDKGDNIPGYTGIGPKRATDLLKEYGSAYNIYDSVPLPDHYKYMQEITKIQI